METTLAWKIYKNQTTQYEFPTHICINFSQELNKKDVFLNLLREFTNQDMPSLVIMT